MGQTCLHKSSLLSGIRHVGVFVIHAINHCIVAGEVHFVREIIQIIGVQLKPHGNSVFDEAPYVPPRFFDGRGFLRLDCDVEPGC
ncbi:hypothetical protein D1872_241750 [compost metagenome]